MLISYTKIHNVDTAVIEITVYEMMRLTDFFKCIQPSILFAYIKIHNVDTSRIDTIAYGIN